MAALLPPINKERLETELSIRFRSFGTGWRYDWQSDGMLARVVRPTARKCRSPTTPSAAASENLLQERPRSSFGTATFPYTNGRKKQKKAWSHGSSSKTRSYLPPNLLPTATVSPSSPTTSAHPCKPTTSRATRCGSRNWTSTGGKGNARLHSFRLSIRGSTRMRRRDCITIVSAITS